ncbi:hypothetical protein [Demequina zhanjiangensis]|uniref:Uncharacterized protein n=1 Tax=Demequina zhanjiangensis TaxID=3051659 RepID=A0ABT8G353_9MICO|nr:hypothetical protein [Demequina sp. SYSU T00b26]MDN4473573.1 hypothetical protein [Demequina sp. SYSU T00b26]
MRLPEFDRVMGTILVMALFVLLVLAVVEQNRETERRRIGSLEAGLCRDTETRSSGAQITVAAMVLPTVAIGTLAVRRGWALKAKRAAIAFGKWVLDVATGVASAVVSRFLIG